MFERYSEQARRTLFFARYEASQSGSTTIQAEHLLLGLVREGKGITSRIFARAGVSLTDLHRETVKGLTDAVSAKPATPMEIPFAGPMKQVLQQAAMEADALGHREIGTEHLLLAFLAVRDSGQTAPLLSELTHEQVKRDVAQRHDETPPAPTRGAGPRHPLAGKPELPPSYTVHIAPSTRPPGTASTAGPTWWAAYGFTLKAALARLLDVGEACIELAPDFDAHARFDIAVVLPQLESPTTIGDLVRQGIERHFGFTLALEARPMDVYVLTPDPSRPSSPERAGIGAISGGFLGAVDLPFGGMPASEQATIEQFMEIMRAAARVAHGVTAIGGDAYVRKIQDLPEPMLQQIRDQFGVVATPGRREGLVLIAAPL